MPDGYVTVANFTIPLDAEMARMKLESEEIPVFLVDGYTTGLYPAWGGAIGIRLQVPFEYAETATNLLESSPWYAVASYNTWLSGNVCTQRFDRMTNAAAYYFKVKGDESP